MNDLVIAVIACAGLLGLWWWVQSRSASEPAEARLRRICLGNHDQVERLIAAEASRTPGLSRSEAAERAVRRYERDNR